MQTTQPEQSGFSAARLQRLNALFQGYVDRGELAGISATVARAGKTVYADTFGHKDREAQKPLQFDTIFMIASMTKAISSVAAMMLYEEGHFSLNTPLHKFIPAYRDTKVWAGKTETGYLTTDLDTEITMRHLFTHTSGLCYGFNPNDPIDQLYRENGKKAEKEGVVLTNAVLANFLASMPLAFQPGTRWRYGYNIEVIGRVIEIISGQTLADFLQQRIFDPLGMTDTGFFVPAQKRDRLAVVYGHPEDSPTLLRLDQTTPPAELPPMHSGGGGLSSTLPDYARFLQMLVNGGELDGARLLSPRTVAMYSNNYAPEQALPYGFAEKDLYHAGYGFSLGTRVLLDPSKTGMYGSVGEFGWDGAFSTYFWVDPKEALYGLMMLQHYPNAYYPIAPQFKALTYQAMVE
ncbi:MAG: beta-lactamase family protein [Anaerolineaceae bacterium]|nr:beta-lactamase family protein [Anaerolineaceae bacterium]